MPKLTRKTALGIKTETTQGTLNAPTATDYLYAADVKVKPVPEIIARDYYRSTISPITPFIGKRYYEVSFKTPLKNGGSRGTIYAPLDACLQACGLTSTVVGATSVTYAPVSVASSANYFGPGHSCSIYVNYDGVLYSIVGAMAKTAKITLDAGKQAWYEFTLLGAYTDPSDAVMPTQTYLTNIEPIVQSCALSVQGYSFIASKLDLDISPMLVERPDTSSVLGIKGWLVVGRGYKGTFDPEMESIATQNMMNLLMAGTEGALSVVMGSGSGYITTITAPKLLYTGVEPADRGGIRIQNVPFQLDQSTGDDEISIALT